MVDSLKEAERIHGMRTAPDAATEAFHASGRRTGQVARAGRGRGRGSAAEHQQEMNPVTGATGAPETLGTPETNCET